MMLLDVWGDFSNWVSVTWSSTTFIVVLCVFAIFGLMCFLTFVKKSFNKGDKVVWSYLVTCIIFWAIAGVIALARFV